MGTRWRVGSGVHIKVWHDKWIPRNSTYRLVTPPDTMNNNMRVTELIEENGRKWNEELIRKLMMPEDADVILSIPLASNTEDKLVWHLSKNGRFSVRSAYNLAVNIEELKIGGCSNSLSKNHWDFIWKSVAPHRVQLFCWKACFNALPTASNLIKRRAHIENCCLQCGSQGEDIHHILLSCHFSRLVWALSDIPWSALAEWRSGCEEWMRNTVKNLDSKQSGWFMTICWSLWNNRNKKVMENLTEEPLHLIQNARRFYLAFYEAISAEPRDETPHIQENWSKLGEGWIKVNFDGAISNEKKGGSVGVIARDYNGQCVGWDRNYFPGICEPLHIEAEAARIAAELVTKRRWQRVIIEGDYFTVIHQLEYEDSHLASISPVLNDIHEMLKTVPSLITQLNM
ncbi:UNVERIFIED_CONTAM: hypothetical protein Slati_3686300 [Sesamum latifolium]|uniref:Reverse transcriptase zinc-binding domain-containing protein n=1 Tax=Sesamum latifolium TaxID=2727402 RepID=A0AAW2U5S0_9LAMI